jgi:hypothetical protein
VIIDLAKLQWGNAVPSTNFHGYHEAAFSINDDETGFVFVPDTALHFVKPPAAEQ